MFDRRSEVTFSCLDESWHGVVSDGNNGRVEISRKSETPLYVQLAEELEAAMLRGDHKPGDRLPTEQGLAERYGVNRHTAGQAYNHLQGKGLVYRVKGRGTYVRPGRIEYRIAQKMSFSDSVSRAGMQPFHRVTGVRQIGAYGRIAEDMTVPVGERLVAYEGVSFAGEVPLGCGTKYLREKLFPGIYGLLLYRGHESRSALIKARYGVELRRARSVFEIEPAEGETTQRLGVPPGAALLKVGALDTLKDGTPAQWGVSFFRGDAARMYVDTGEIKEEDH